MFADDTFTIDSGPDLNTVINIEINKIAVDVHVPTVVYCIMKTKMVNHLTKMCSVFTPFERMHDNRETSDIEIIN